MEITSLTAAFSGLKNATEIAKFIKNSASTLEAAEIKLQLAELIDNLADAKMEIANAKEVILEKESEFRKFKKQIEIDSHVFWEDPYYFQKDNRDKKDGPYCQKCYDSQKMLIRLQSPNKNGFWECKECESTYQDKEFNSDTPIITSSRRGGIDWSGY
jgi:ribosomal protein L37AE/L43A